MHLVQQVVAAFALALAYICDEVNDEQEQDKRKCETDDTEAASKMTLADALLGEEFVLCELFYHFELSHSDAEKVSRYFIKSDCFFKELQNSVDSCWPICEVLRHGIDLHRVKKIPHLLKRDRYEHKEYYLAENNGLCSGFDRLFRYFIKFSI